MNADIFKNPTVIWFLIGLGLMLLELMVPGLILIFFGIGAWIVALICLFADININWQIFIFIIASSISIALLRKYLKTRFFKTKDGKDDSLDDEFVGKTAVVISDILPDHPGKVEFKGSPWRAVSEEEIKEGTTVVITDKDSITLIVKPK